jgi:hypothetical protein
MEMEMEDGRQCVEATGHALKSKNTLYPPPLKQPLQIIFRPAMIGEFVGTSLFMIFALGGTK